MKTVFTQWLQAVAQVFATKPEAPRGYYDRFGEPQITNHAKRRS